MSKTIETDLRTFVKFWMVPLGIAATVFILYKALTGLIIIGISIFLALALKPLVRRVNEFFTRHFGKDKKHQKLSAVMAYLIVVLALGAVIAIVGPVVINETSKFFHQLPEMFKNWDWGGINDFGRSIGIDNLQTEITNALNSLSNNILSGIGSNFVASVSGIADVVMKSMLVLILTLLFLLEGPGMLNSFWAKLSDTEDNKSAVAVSKRIVAKMAGVVSTYVSRQMIVAMIDGLASGLITFLLSLIFGFSSSLAIPMGMITMTFYLIPMFGQFIGGTLVTIILLVSSPAAALVFAIVYIIYAQIENNVISPKIQGSALNLPAVAILCAIVIGMYMFGLLGAIISVPIAGCIRVLVEEYPQIKAAARK